MSASIERRRYLDIEVGCHRRHRRCICGEGGMSSSALPGVEQRPGGRPPRQRGEG